MWAIAAKVLSPLDSYAVFLFLAHPDQQIGLMDRETWAVKCNRRHADLVDWRMKTLDIPDSRSRDEAKNSSAGAECWEKREIRTVGFDFDFDFLLGGAWRLACYWCLDTLANAIRDSHVDDFALAAMSIIRVSLPGLCLACGDI